MRGWRRGKLGQRRRRTWVQFCSPAPTGADGEMQPERLLSVGHLVGDAQPRGSRWGRNLKESSVQEQRAARRWRPAGLAGAELQALKTLWTPG